MEMNRGQGMIPPGKYVHRMTGNVIMVRDCVQDGEHLLVICDKGQITMKEFGEYIQVEDGDEIYVPNVSDLFGDRTPNKELIARINQGIDPEDRIEIRNKNEQKEIVRTENNSTIDITSTDKEVEVKSKAETEENPNYELIKKVFEKFPLERTISFEINEEEWPFQQFSMLVNVLDVPIEDICSYVIDKYLDKESLAKSLSMYFLRYIK